MLYSNLLRINLVIVLSEEILEALLVTINFLLPSYNVKFLFPTKYIEAES